MELLTKKTREELNEVLQEVKAAVPFWATGTEADERIRVLTVWATRKIEALEEEVRLLRAESDAAKDRDMTP